MRNQLLSFVVTDLILQFMKLRQSACITLQAVSDGNEDGFFFGAKYLELLHKHSAPAIVLDVWVWTLAPREFKAWWNSPWKML